MPLHIDDFEAEDEWELSTAKYIPSGDIELNELRKQPINERSLAQAVIRETLQDHVDYIRRQRGLGMIAGPSKERLYDEASAKSFFTCNDEHHTYIRHFWCSIAGWEECRVVDWFWKVDKKAHECDLSFKRMKLVAPEPQHKTIDDSEIESWFREMLIPAPRLAEEMMKMAKERKFKPRQVWIVKRRLGIKTVARRNTFPRGKREWRFPNV